MTSKRRREMLWQQWRYAPKRVERSFCCEWLTSIWKRGPFQPQKASNGGHKNKKRKLSKHWTVFLSQKFRVTAPKVRPRWFYSVPICRLGSQNEAKREEIVDARKVFKKGLNIFEKNWNLEPKLAPTMKQQMSRKQHTTHIDFLKDVLNKTLTFEVQAILKKALETVSEKNTLWWLYFSELWTLKTGANWTKIWSKWRCMWRLVSRAVFGGPWSGLSDFDTTLKSGLRGPVWGNKRGF